MNEIQFDSRLKLIAKILFLSNLLDLFFYNSAKPIWANALNIGFSIAFGTLVAWGILRRKNWARILVYICLVLGLISLTTWPEFTLAQKTAFAIGMLPFLALLYHFHRYPALTSQYFRAESARKKWTIALVVLGTVIVLIFGGITLAGLYFRQQGASLMAEMKSKLALEGTVDPKVMNTCNEKFGRKIEDPAILEKFCHCFSLNMDKVAESSDAKGSFVTRSVALTMACWPAEAPPMEGMPE